MAAQVKITNLRFEHHPTGLGIPVSRPRLSWKVTAVGSVIPKSWVQKSYEIEIKRQSNEPETFRIDDASTVLVPWPASGLRSSEFAKVRIRSFGQSAEQGDNNTDWSEWATVEAALLEKSDWTAKTITFPERTDTKHPDENGTRPIRFRKTFTILDKPARSRLYITALGLYEAYLNGHRIGAECLAPGWTALQHRIQIQAFDIGPLLQLGSNTLVVEVAEGFYSGRMLWGAGVRQVYGKHNALLAQLHVFETPEAISPLSKVQTDESWECRLSPTVASGIYDGETYDLGLEYDVWDTAASWSPAMVMDTPDIVLTASACPPVRVTETVPPIAIWKDPEGSTLVDFGQNLVGRLHIPHLAKPDGTRLAIRYAEVLEHGKLGTRPLRSAKATDTIIFGGGRVLKNWFPHYTYHGFRYVELTGWSAEDETPLTLDSLVAQVLHTDMARTGYFTCSDDKLNKLHQNVVWSMRGNFVGIPTDCPQRDERLGWTGDIQVFCPTASFLYDCGGMLANWMQDLIIEQKEDNGIVPLVVPNTLRYAGWVPKPQAVWDDVVILVPWVLYNRFGDAKVLRDSWDGMKDHVETLRRGEDRLWDLNLWQLADWLDPNAPPDSPGLARTDGVLVADEYLVHVTGIMSKIAQVLSLVDEAQKFQADHDRLKQTFQDKYIAKSGLIVGDSQTSLALSIVFDLHSTSAQKQMAADRLKRLVRTAQFKVSTGFAGTPVVLDALTQGGHVDVAYRMLLEEKCPSWLYPVSKGATTIWERWDSMLENGDINPGSMTSFNHYALGSVANWLHSTVGGLSPLEPGWKKFLVQPTPGGTLTSANATFHSPNGEIVCSWQLDENQNLKLKLTVPINTTASVSTPDGVFNVGSGRHEFEWRVTKGNVPWPPEPLLPEL
ncbi:bacterial alpha-L-rhamnosidase domain-containing protein [Trichoderma compactum]